MLQDMIDKVIETGKCFSMEMNVKKTKVMRISRQPFPVKITIDQKQLENVESFKYLGSILSNDRRYTCEISKRKANWIGHILCRNGLLQRVTEGKRKGWIEVTGRRGRRRRKLLDDFKERRGYSHL